MDDKISTHKAKKEYFYKLETISKQNLMKAKYLILYFFSTFLAIFAALYLYDFWNNRAFVTQSEALPLQFVSNMAQPSVEINFDFTRAVEASVDAVVHITTTINKEKYLNENPLLEYFLGENNNFDMPIMGAGSGVILSSDGYIVTNNHVLANYDKINVILNDKRSFKAKIIGRDLSTDLALLKIDAQNLIYLNFSNSDSSKVGEWVLAVGNPFNLTSTVTAGIISAKARNIGLLKDKEAVESFIQTDAAVNPGNSGGALINPKGELVGINTAIASRTGSYAGYSFAIPSNIVKKVVSDLKLYGTVQRAMLGVNLEDITQDLATKHELNTLEGAFVSEIISNGAAANSGIKAHDIITSINGNKISKVSELQEQISRFHPGDKIKLLVARKNSTHEITVVLRNAEGSEELKSYSEISVLGASFRPLLSEELQQFGLDFAIRVESIKSGKLESANVPVGFIITKFNNKKLKSMEEFKGEIENYKGGVYLEGLLPNGEKAYFAFGIN